MKDAVIEHTHRHTKVLGEGRAEFAEVTLVVLFDQGGTGISLEGFSNRPGLDDDEVSAIGEGARHALRSLDIDAATVQLVDVKFMDVHKFVDGFRSAGAQCVLEAVQLIRTGTL